MKIILFQQAMGFDISVKTKVKKSRKFFSLKKIYLNAYIFFI